MTRWSRCLTGILVVGLSLVAGPALPGDQPTGEARPPVAPPAGGGLIAILDAEGATGLGPADEIAILLGEASAAGVESTSSEGLELVELPDGSLMVDLEGRFRNALVAHLDADGRISVAHGPIEPAPQPSERPSEAGGER